MPLLRNRGRSGGGKTRLPYFCADPTLTRRVIYPDAVTSSSTPPNASRGEVPAGVTARALG